MPARLPAIRQLPCLPPAFGLAPSVTRALPLRPGSSCPPLLHRRPPSPLPLSLRTIPCALQGGATPQSPPPTNPGPANANQGLANLNELTERISDLLHVGSIEKSLHTPAFAPDHARLGHLDASTHVVVVFGKRLIRDQVSVEYAKRIVTLVKQLAGGTLAPHIICFTGGRAPDGYVSEAAAGYAFFRSVCEEAAVDVNAYSYLLEEKSANTSQNVHNVIAALRRRCPPEAVSNCHFTLVSSDYHLIRLQEVHRLNVNSHESALFPLQRFSATWNFIFAAYPFCVSRDPATAFLGRAIVLANDLSIVLVNLNCAVANSQFMARENLHRLRETFAKMRDMYRVIDSRSASGFRTDMRKHAETLELAIHRVREVQTTLAPLSEDGLSVPQQELELAQRLLMSAVRDIRHSMDPDRVLLVADRVAVVEDMASYTNRDARRRPRRRDDDDDLHQLHRARPHTPAGARARVAHHLLPKQRRARAGKTAHADYLSSELAGHGGATFAGNGKRIARDGPNVVVLDEMAHVAQPDDNGVAVLDDRAQNGPAVSVKRDAADRAPAGNANGAPMRTPRASAATRRAASTPTAPRKRRSSTLPAKTKASAPGRSGAAKRKTPARKTSDLS